jgi:tetratricopeptide (TPR) repeat protein
MAKVYYMKKQNNLSLEYCQKALDILPDDHEYRTRVYRKAGNVYLDKTKFILALDYYKKTLVLQEQTLPEDHVELSSHKLIKQAESNIQTVNNLKNNTNTSTTDPSS